MKKIGIATLHYSDNYGAVIQSWALRKVINSLQGCRAEIINYIPDNHKYSLYVNDDVNRENLIKKRALFDEFLEKECGLDSYKRSSIQDEDYDYICVGSDQVWNLTFRHTSNGEYLLPNVKKAKKISYAASIGLKLCEAYKYNEIFEKYLPFFDNLSLREDEQIELVQKTSGKPCIRVLDPSLLIDVNEYKKLCSKVKKDKSDFIFLFWLPHLGELDKRKNLEIANRLSQKYGYEIIHNIPDMKSYAIYKDGGCMCYEGVEDFLWYIRNAKIVITNSYHATILSILMDTQFYTTIVGTMSSRFDTLTGLFDIKDRIINRYTNDVKIDNLYKINKQKCFETELEKSINYLKSSFGV